MILENKTSEVFGYEFESLKSSSHKRICLKCDYCGSEYDAILKNRNLGYTKLPKDACNDCRYIKREEIGNNPFSRPEVQEKIRQTNIKKYGVEYQTQSDNFKEKSKVTCLEKYGAETYLASEEGKEAYEDTCLEKYGVDNVSKIPEVRDKAKKTCLEKFGSEFFYTSDECKQRILDKYNVKNVFESELIKQKITETNLDKYGFTSHMKVKEIAKVVSEKSMATKIENGTITTVDGKLLSDMMRESEASKTQFYKVYKSSGLDAALNYQRGKTNIEMIIESILTRNNIGFKEQVKLNNYIADFVCEDLIIEANGNYWHSEKFADKFYHRNKRKVYIELGYRSLFFTSDEIETKPLIVESIIKNKLGLSERISGRKTEFKQITKQEGKEFLNENHLMGNGAGNCYALFNNDTIFSVIQIKNIKDGYKEISRFCIKNGYSIVGGFSKMIKNIGIYKLKTFVDLRYGTGEHLESMGFVSKTTELSFSWTDGSIRIHRMKFPGKTGYENNLVKIWDCGQKPFFFN